MKVKGTMHKGVDWVSPGIPVTELAKLMCGHDIGSIPIGENDQLIGSGQGAVHRHRRTVPPPVEITGAAPFC
jgi:CBS domain-containing protein